MKITDLFLKAGSTMALAVALDLHQLTVERWRKHGIPLKYWARIERLYGFSPTEIYKMNEVLRKSKY